MKISTDINCFYGKYSIEETIDIISGAGFDAIDFTFMDKRYYNGDYSENECKKHYSEIKKYAENKGIFFNQSHAPCPSAVDDAAETEKLFGNIVRAMRNASFLGIDIIVVHGKDNLDYSEEAERLFEMNMEFYNRLLPYCKDYNIKIAIENLPQSHKFPNVHSAFGCYKVKKSICATPEEFNRYLDELDSRWFVACLDIGHALITGQNPQEMICALGGERLKALHIHDNNGLRDMHTIPYFGGMAEWDKIMKALKKINYSGDFNLEAGNFLNLLPQKLYPEGTRLMAAVAGHIAEMMD